MRLEMLVEMQIELPNRRGIFGNCKFKFIQNLNLSLYGRYREIQIEANSHFEFVPRDTEEFEFLDFD